jgi:hypothetical protein
MDNQEIEIIFEEIQDEKQAAQIIESVNEIVIDIAAKYYIDKNKT